MTPAAYLIRVRTELTIHPLIKTFSLVEERTETDGGYLRTRLRLINEDFLELAEYFVVDGENLRPKRYRYQWMNADQTRLYKRWDNVHHYPHLPGFPHHVHFANGEVESALPRSILAFLANLNTELEAVSGAANPPSAPLDYNPTTFSQGRMDFTWEELSDEARAQAYADWAAGKGLIGGDPRRRPGSDLLPKWGLDKPFFRTLALDDARARNGERLRDALTSERPLEIEIGYGRGDFLLDRARRFPDRLFIGYETKTKATRLMLQRVERINGERLSVPNLWLSDDDVRFSLPRVVPDGRADAIHILFPDPWWKEQHRVRRLFSPPFVDLLAQKLRSGGLLFFKSDVKEYGELVRYLVENHADFAAHDAALATRIGDYVPTHREHWCTRNEKPVFGYYFARC